MQSLHASKFRITTEAWDAGPRAELVLVRCAVLCCGRGHSPGPVQAQLQLSGPHLVRGQQQVALAARVVVLVALPLA